jgi:hypothetical protein
MKTIEQNKKFDCIQMKNDIQAKIYTEIKGLNTEELLSYFNTPIEKRRSTFRDQLNTRFAIEP